MLICISLPYAYISYEVRVADGGYIYRAGMDYVLYYVVSDLICIWLI